MRAAVVIRSADRVPRVIVLKGFAMPRGIFVSPESRSALWGGHGPLPRGLYLRRSGDELPIRVIKYRNPPFLRLRRAFCPTVVLSGNRSVW
jgi:hypothetical protein